MNSTDLVAGLSTIIPILIIISIFLFILGIAVCFAIISMKNALNDVADVYCKINQEKYREAKKLEASIEKTNDNE